MIRIELKPSPQIPYNSIVLEKKQYWNYPISSHVSKSIEGLK